MGSTHRACLPMDPMRASIRLFPWKGTPLDPIRSIYEDDPDMMEIVREFAEELPGRAAAIEQGLEGGDLASVMTLAHQLKGAGGGYGFPQISEVAARLEQALKEREDDPVVKERAAELVEVVRAVVVPA